MQEQSGDNSDKKNYNEQITKFRGETYSTYVQNQQDFEKQLIFISSGSLGLSMFFIEKIVKDINQAEFKFLLACGWLMLSITLLLNLISHFVGNRFNYKTIKEIDEGNYDETKAIRRNKNLNRINFISLVTLVIGILSIITFSTINIFSINKENNDMTKQVIKSANCDTDKGIVTGPPPTKPVTIKK